MKKIILIVCSILTFATFVEGQSSLLLGNRQIRLQWEKDNKGWRISQLSLRKNGKWVMIKHVSGEGTLIYSKEAPNRNSIRKFEKSTGGGGENDYPSGKISWNYHTNGVALNTAGTAIHYFSQSGKKTNTRQVQFEYHGEHGSVFTEFSLDPDFEGDILVKQTLTVKKDGYFSLATPTLFFTLQKDFVWTTVPGYFQGNSFQKDFIKAYAYGMGVPELPVIFRERCASTLCPLVSNEQGVTLSVIPSPGFSRDLWAGDSMTHSNWYLGLSHMNRKSELTPTLYYPVLGEERSFMKKGDALIYTFRYSVSESDWFQTIKHAVYDVYQFRESLALRQSKQSLTSRILNMRHYLTDSSTSLWRLENFNGMQIGAQAYLGGVVGSNNDAMKNSDYGAMFYLANVTGDTVLKKKVMPFALNFKLAQQIDIGFFKGAVAGQYYLSKSKKFVEEWGRVIEPIGVTYYTMLDIGNVLLFEPDNAQLKAILHSGAEFLLRTQKPDGSWGVAYDDDTKKEIFKDIPDARPTFYGLLVAYKILKDIRYLKAAQKGADWYLKNCVTSGYYLGVCGDARYVADFATGQSAQALLDLFDITYEKKYKMAAIDVAKVYVSSIYTHPIPSTTIKKINSNQMSIGGFGIKVLVITLN